MMDLFKYDFGYTGPWLYGHAIAAVLFGALAVSAWRFKWRRWSLVLSSVLTLWALAGFCIVQCVVRINLPLELPSEHFLESGAGRVLDAGAGSGRSALMVLLARPDSTVTALDIFVSGYGIGGNTPERLRANAQAAGVADRLEVQTGDMRKMPLADASFDAALSAYAIDHLNAEGIAQSLSEVQRVLHPGGEFLLMVINQDAWIRVAFPFLVHHGYFGPKTAPERWRRALTDAGFEIIEQGTRPATLYFLARKP